MPTLAQMPRLQRPPDDPSPAPPPAARPLRYFAFLSYSHRDEQSARWLHDSLERFRVPSALVGRVTDQGLIPSRLTPIFRDRRELPASQDLGEEIREALAASRFLVVLCSPDSARSRWTNAEIESFKRLRPDGCILAAIVAGEPFASDHQGREKDECLPPALRFRYDRRGRATSKRAEPLCADLRDSGDGRRHGLLKIVAGMLGVGLDDLVQRDSVRRQRRLALIAAASAVGMVLTSGLAVAAFDARDSARDQRREAESLVGFMLGDLRSRLEPLGRLDVLDSVGARALSYYESQDKESLSDESLAQRSKALTLMGEIANTRGNLDAALRLYREAFAGTAEAVRRDPDNPERLFDHAQNVFWIGYIDWQRGRLDRAEAAFREYKRLAQRLLAIDPRKPEWQLEAKYADSNLGSVLLQQNRFAEAAAMFEASLNAVEALAASEPDNLAYQKSLAESLAWLADARVGEGRLEEAMAQRERQLAQLEQLKAAHPGDTIFARQAMSARSAMARLLASRGDIAGGLDHARQATADADALLRTEPGNTEWLEAAARSQFELAELLRVERHLPAAAAAVRAGCDIGIRLAAKDRTVRSWNEDLRLMCLHERARLALANAAPAEALSLARQAIALAERSRGSNRVERGIAVARSHELAGDSLARLGRPAQAQASWRRAAGEWPKQVPLRPLHLAQQAVLLRKLGDVGGAGALAAKLDAMGYRHPEYGPGRG